MTNQTSSIADALSPEQRARLVALLDTVLPASTDGAMPSAGDIDFPAYLADQAPGFASTLVAVLDGLDAGFPALDLDTRVARLRTFADRDAATFKDLVFRIYDAYYQDDRVRAAIGARPGPPFPNGFSIPAGNLSSLEAVKARGKGYRRIE